MALLENKLVQCNFGYLEPGLSRLAGHQKIQYYYYACAEGMTNDLLWVWLHIE